MSKYEVIIRYTVTKTYTVSAPDKSEAIEWVYCNGSSLNDGVDENYEEEILNVEEVK